MEPSRFDHLARRFRGVGTRRGLLRFITSLPVAGSMMAGLGGELPARRKRKKRKKPPPCTPLCLDKVCGPDGCGGSCGNCGEGQACQDGACTGCAPTCDGKQCGPDGCGGECPPGCDSGFACDGDGSCRCESGRVCADTCCTSGQVCHRTTDRCCTPEPVTTTCAGRACGEVTDPCGTTVDCGDCPQGKRCNGQGECVCDPDCQGRSCGPDGCGGSCGDCAADRTCDAQGQCACRFASCQGACCRQGEVCQGGVCTCTPDCADKSCGPDGCGGSCGECGEDQVCQGGTCVDRPCDVCAVGCAFTSVQAAVNAAPAGATVTICPGSYAAALTIGKNLRLVGAGDGTLGTILQGTSAASVVEVSSGVTVTLKKLRITGGRGRLGIAGGVYNRGTTTLIGCTIAGNSSANAGGGLGNMQGTLTLTGCTVSGNTAEYRGGGIANREGALIVTNSTIADNTADFTSSDPGGGGIHSYHGTVELTGCTVSGNRARIVGGGIYAEWSDVALTECTVGENSVTYVGFGLSTGNRGGGIAAEMSSLTLTRSAVSSNVAHEGGGIFITGDGENLGKLKLVESEIRGNRAIRLSGGGIRNASAAVELVRSFVRENSACCENEQAGGGGISTLFGAVKLDQDSKVIENGAQGSGGGIYNGRGAVGLASFDNVVGNSPNNCAGDPVANCLN